MKNYWIERNKARHAYKYRLAVMGASFPIPYADSDIAVFGDCLRIYNFSQPFQKWLEGCRTGKFSGAYGVYPSPYLSSVHNPLPYFSGCDALLTVYMDGYLARSYALTSLVIYDVFPVSIGPGSNMLGCYVASVEVPKYIVDPTFQKYFPDLNLGVLCI